MVKPQPWWELRLVVPASVADDVAALLVVEGALGAELVGAAGAAVPTAIAERPWSAAPVASDAREVELVVSYPGEWSRAAVQAAARPTLAGIGQGQAAVRLRRRAERDWAEAWKRHFHPMRFGARLWIAPSWEPPPRVGANAHVITLDPGLAFGTGQHETTALCLEVLEARLAPGATLLDVGCGSGVLAIAAALLGGRSIVAIDNDRDAVAVARENIAANKVRVRTGAAPLARVRGRFDWVVANITADVLTVLAESLVGHLAPGGTLLLSGLLAVQEREVRRVFRAASPGALRIVERRARGEWVALVLRARRARGARASSRSGRA